MVKYIKGFFKYRFLLRELVRKGVKLKYRKSYLGIIWSLIEPILTTIVLVLVFGTLLGHREKDFSLYIVCGRLLYTFFSSGTKQSMTSIRRNASMIRKVYVPKYLYPLAEILFNYIIFFISLLVLVLVMIYCSTVPTVLIWQVIPALLMVLLLTIGMGMILSTLHVFFRDTEYLWNVVLMLIMYMCAIFYYPNKILESGHAWLLRYNPLYCIIDIFRGGIMGYMADSWNYIFAGAVSVLSVIIGTYIFWKKQDEFILHI